MTATTILLSWDQPQACHQASARLALGSAKHLPGSKSRSLHCSMLQFHTHLLLRHLSPAQATPRAAYGSLDGKAPYPGAAVGLAALNLTGASREATDPLWPHPCRQEPAI